MNRVTSSLDSAANSDGASLVAQLAQRDARARQRRQPRPPVVRRPARVRQSARSTPPARSPAIAAGQLLHQTSCVRRSPERAPDEGHDGQQSSKEDAPARSANRREGTTLQWLSSVKRPDAVTADTQDAVAMCSNIGSSRGRNMRRFKRRFARENAESCRQFGIVNTCRSIAHRVGWRHPPAVDMVLHAGGPQRCSTCLIVGGGPAGSERGADAGPLPPPVLVLRSRPAAQPPIARAARLPDARRHRARRTSTSSAARELPAYGVELRTVGVTGARQARRSLPRRARRRRQEAARFLLIATGVVDDLPAIAGFDECYGRSLFHCPYCDGWEVRDRRLAAFGRGAHVAGLALGAENLERRRRRLHQRQRGSTRRLRERLRAQRRRGPHRADRAARTRRRRADARRVRVGRSAAARRACSSATGQHPQSDLAIKLGCTLTAAAR